MTESLLQSFYIWTLALRQGDPLSRSSESCSDYGHGQFSIWESLLLKVSNSDTTAAGCLGPKASWKHVANQFPWVRMTLCTKRYCIKANTMFKLAQQSWETIAAKVLCFMFICISHRVSLRFCTLLPHAGWDPHNWKQKHCTVNSLSGLYIALAIYSYCIKLHQKTWSFLYL